MGTLQASVAVFKVWIQRFSFSHFPPQQNEQSGIRRRRMLVYNLAPIHRLYAILYAFHKRPIALEIVSQTYKRYLKCC